MGSERKLVMLAIDGSNQSLEMANYLSGMLNLSQTEIVLFHVMGKVPEIFWDSEKDPKVSKIIADLETWDQHKEAKIREFMEQVKKKFVDAGVPQESVTVTIQKRKAGMARDILQEAGFGFHLVGIGRRGIGTAADEMIGSVASKVLFNLVDTPLCLVGGAPRPGRILVAVDKSLGSIRVLNFIINMFGGKDHEILLAHVVRAPVEENGESAMDFAEQLAHLAQHAIKPLFHDAIESLCAVGFKSSRIKTKVITGVSSRATALMNEGRTGEYDTIVVGRRGISDIERFPMGRVTAKLAQVAKDTALWIVS